MDIVNFLKMFRDAFGGQENGVNYWFGLNTSDAPHQIHFLSGLVHDALVLDIGNKKNRFQLNLERSRWEVFNVEEGDAAIQAVKSSLVLNQVVQIKNPPAIGDVIDGVHLCLSWRLKNLNHAEISLILDRSGNEVVSTFTLPVSPSNSLHLTDIS